MPSLATTAPASGKVNSPSQLAAKPAIKLTVREAGWYRVTQPELIAAGLDPKFDPRRLQLYLAGSEQPRLVIGETDGRFDQTDAIEFYGDGQDTPETDALMQAGNNTVTLAAENGAADISLLDHIRITYPRLCRADQNRLSLMASNANGPSQMIDGFTSPPIRVFDVTDPLAVTELADGFNFEAAATALQPLIPAGWQVNQIDRGHLDGATAKAQLLAAINRGQRIVNYLGHGNVTQWKGDWLTDQDVRAMTNQERLPVFVLMTCLNGYFHDPLVDSLGESLLKAERGGAVAAGALSAMTEPNAQAVMNREFYRLVFGASTTLGDAALRAKAVAQDPDIRRTWVLPGDPTMRLK